MQEKFNKKKSTQAHLASFYQQQQEARIDIENDRNKLMLEKEFLYNKKLMEELQILSKDDWFTKIIPL